MIGILAKPTETRTVEEFFELFKTPWEFYVPGRAYDVVIVTREEVPDDLGSAVRIIYNSNRTSIDDEIEVATGDPQRTDWLTWDGTEFPVYGKVSELTSSGRCLVKIKATAKPVGTKAGDAIGSAVRFGFDLFGEVAFLLSKGQPAEKAGVATLDTQIALLRAVMIDADVPFVEIPPAPAGYDFMACLTHDVDFVGIRDHKWDSTMWGFLYRCFLGSLRSVFRGRMTWSMCWQNWRAGLSLPLVYLGLREDFWLEFDRYAQIERGLGSTFYFIPFKNHAGTRGSNDAPKRRAAKYDFAEIKEQVLDLVKQGCEIGLHGVDAWQDSARAGMESARIREVSGLTAVGTRMHWLYWDQNSPQVLEAAGLAYDSTFGYNDAIGFRSGTAQVFRLAGATTLLELPLNIQDTALFYPDRMDLSEGEAMETCRSLIRKLVSSGGALTINWHTRSLSPERQWGDFYLRLLGEIKRYPVWFARARDVVEWFRTRRQLRFERVSFDGDRVQVKLSGHVASSRPSFRVRVHHPRLRSRQMEFSLDDLSRKSENDPLDAGGTALTIPYQEPQFEGAQHV